MLFDNRYPKLETLLKEELEKLYRKGYTAEQIVKGLYAMKKAYKEANRERPV